MGEGMHPPLRWRRFRDQLLWRAFVSAMIEHSLASSATSREQREYERISNPTKCPTASVPLLDTLCHYITQKNVQLRLSWISDGAY